MWPCRATPLHFSLSLCVAFYRLPGEITGLQHYPQSLWSPTWPFSEQAVFFSRFLKWNDPCVTSPHPSLVPKPFTSPPQLLRCWKLARISTGCSGKSVSVSAFCFPQWKAKFNESAQLSLWPSWKNRRHQCYYVTITTACPAPSALNELRYFTVMPQMFM